MKLSDWTMLVAIILMLTFICTKNTEHKTTTFNNVVANAQNAVFNNVAASVQNTIDK